MSIENGIYMSLSSRDEGRVEALGAVIRGHSRVRRSDFPAIWLADRTRMERRKLA